MATIINTPSNTDGGSSGAGWAVAVVILLVVVAVGAYFFYYRAAPTAGDGMNINVTLPNPTTDNQPTTP